MTDQLSLASLDHAAKKKRTQRNEFLSEMAAIVAVGEAPSTDRAALSQALPQGGRKTIKVAAVLGGELGDIGWFPMHAERKRRAQDGSTTSSLGC